MYVEGVTELPLETKCCMPFSSLKRKYAWPHSYRKLENERDRVYFPNILRIIASEVVFILKTVTND